MLDNKTTAEEKQIARRPFIKVIRYIIQWTIVIIVVYGGIYLFKFSEYVLGGEVPHFKKPLSVEGFMPIGALMSLKLWLVSGLFDPVHPAALVIFTAALLLALLLKKGFCGWICPVGTVSEITWKAGKKLFGKNVNPPAYIDYPLRAVKYILMVLFLYVILIRMSPEAIKGFLYTPYWKVADFKLLVFFTDMSTTTIVVLLLITVCSLIVKNFWCRYLCPYGGLLGLLSMISPFKVTRNDEKCIHCMTCTRSCPSLLSVESKERLSSPECIGCLTCVSNCPAKGALDVALPGRRWVHPLVYITLIMIIFWGSITIAKATHHWDAGITVSEYARILPHLEKLQHP